MASTARAAEVVRHGENGRISGQFRRQPLQSRQVPVPVRDACLGPGRSQALLNPRRGREPRRCIRRAVPRCGQSQGGAIAVPRPRHLRTREWLMIRHGPPDRAKRGMIARASRRRVLPTKTLGFLPTVIPFEPRRASHHAAARTNCGLSFYCLDGVRVQSLSGQYAVHFCLRGAAGTASATNSSRSRRIGTSGRGRARHRKRRANRMIHCILYCVRSTPHRLAVPACGA